SSRRSRPPGNVGILVERLRGFGEDSHAWGKVPPGRLLLAGESTPAARAFWSFAYQAVTSPCRCATVPTKESAILNWLLLLGRRFRAWMMPGRAVPTHHDPISDPYQPSNLHARHYR